MFPFLLQHFVPLDGDFSGLMVVPEGFVVGVFIGTPQLAVKFSIGHFVDFLGKLSISHKTGLSWSAPASAGVSGF